MRPDRSLRPLRRADRQGAAPTSPFYVDIDRRLAVLEGPPPTTWEKWNLRVIGQFVLIAGLLSALIILTPNRMFDDELRTFTLTIAALGAWRFGWWFTHAMRAEYYRRVRWPRMRKARDAVWQSGWRPPHLHVQMTTYKEKPAITRHVIESLLSEIRQMGIPATVYVGTGTPFDEFVIGEIARDAGEDLGAELVMIRQNQPGKRMAIGLVMRAIMRTNPHPDDIIVFMDGDTVFGRHSLSRSIALFGSDPELDALTTDEDVICYGPNWMQRWLEMRFAQRRLAMQSHALSHKVLTLTGRMSVFRARAICDTRFVRTIEADFLDHWLWGSFRFLSGDDKSTWYYLLTKGARMTYVPDAKVYTVEVIDGPGMKRVIANLRRWSGNMLRNGARAIALGPRQVGPFIWWCVVDQRIAMWTMLVGPVISILAAFIDPSFLVTLMLWVVLSRIVLSIWLFRFADKVDWTWPIILYVNQVVNAAVKVRLIYFLNRQTWANRGNQQAGEARGWWGKAKNAVAWSQLFIAITLFVWIIWEMSNFIAAAMNPA